MSKVNDILQILGKFRFGSPDEKTVQAQLEKFLSSAGIEFNREYRLDEKNIPDFFIEGIAIELKIKGNSKKIYKQVEKYSAFDEVKELILVTNRSIGFPNEVNGKPCYVVNLGKAWL